MRFFINRLQNDQAPGFGVHLQVDVLVNDNTKAKFLVLFLAFRKILIPMIGHRMFYDKHNEPGLVWMS